jgi:N-acetylglutamate synthase-like GNAT family acetyltransferase
MASVADGQAKFVVREFHPDDYAQVASIFVSGSLEYPELRENAVYVEYLRRSVETDLRDVHGTYMSKGGNFWVATPVDEPSHVVGMVALEAPSEQAGELRRMSVKTEFRRFGIARLLVSTLENWAVAHGFRTVRLTTGCVMHKAQAFYAAAGYSRVGTVEFPGNYLKYKFEKQLE